MLVYVPAQGQAGSRQARLVLPDELLLAHGLVLPERLKSQLSDRQKMLVVGNSMHVAQVGTFLQYVFATRAWSQ